MKLRFLLPAFCCLLCFQPVCSQSLLDKVPVNASLVLKYAGENFRTSLPLRKLESYSFLRNTLQKMLHSDSLSVLENTGIDLLQDAWQYVLIEDSATSLVSLFQLKDSNQFKALLQQNMQAEMRPQYRKGYRQVRLTDELYAAWNNRWAVIIYCSYNGRKNAYEYPAAADTAVALAEGTAGVVDSVLAVTTEEKAEIITTQPAPKIQKPGKTGTTGKKHGTPAKKKPGKGKAAPRKKPAPPPAATEDSEALEAERMAYQDSVDNARREAWYKAQQQHAAAVQQQASDSLMEVAFNQSVVSIRTEASYDKVIDPVAHVSVWLNYDNLMTQYFNLLFRGINRTLYSGLNARHLSRNNEAGFRTGMNIFFDQKRLRLEQKTYTPQPELNSLGREVYNSRQSPALAGYINPGCLAYLSSSLNTEAMAHYWYRLMRQYLSNNPFTGEFADLVDVYMDLMEIIIDEKAIGELLPGNMMMVLHKMDTRTVTYTDYEYDDNFKATEIKKTRQEATPDFSIVFETRKEGFMQKLAQLPLKYAEKGHYKYTDRGGYYELSFDSSKNALRALYFAVKNGRALISTSPEVVQHTLQNTGFSPDAAVMESVMRNNLSLRIDMQQIIRQISPQLSTALSQKISRHFEENMGDVSMESSYRDGIIQATTLMNINGNHSNSLEFFFNMIDQINQIIENDKAGQEIKIN